MLDRLRNWMPKGETCALPNWALNARHSKAQQAVMATLGAYRPAF
jgi:hypothetical protein